MGSRAGKINITMPTPSSTLFRFPFALTPSRPTNHDSCFPCKFIYTNTNLLSAIASIELQEVKGCWRNVHPLSFFPVGLNGRDRRQIRNNCVSLLWLFHFRFWLPIYHFCFSFSDLPFHLSLLSLPSPFVSFVY